MKFGGARWSADVRPCFFDSPPFVVTFSAWVLCMSRVVGESLSLFCACSLCLSFRSDSAHPRDRFEQRRCSHTRAHTQSFGLCSQRTLTIEEDRESPFPSVAREETCCLKESPFLFCCFFAVVLSVRFVLALDLVPRCVSFFFFLVPFCSCDSRGIVRGDRANGKTSYFLVSD